MLTQCQQAAANFIAADKCADALQAAVAASPTLSGAAILGAIIAAALFATATYRAI